MASDPSRRVAGRLFAAGSARSVPATLAIGPDGIVSARPDEGGVLSAPVARLEISDRVGRIARRLTFPGGEVFETEDNDGLDRLLGRHRRRGAGLVPALEQFRPRLALFVVAAVLLAIAIYRYAVPVLVEVAIFATPPVATELMSRSALASLDAAVFSGSGLPEERRAEIGREFEAIAAHARGGPAAYDLNFRAGGQIGANAFALPDGTIVVTDELVAMAGEDGEAVLGVLAHEIGHVARDHALRRLYRAAGIAALIMMIGGDIGAGAQDILVQGAALASLSYSRAQETEADLYAVDLMRLAGRDPAALIRFFELLAESHGHGTGSDFLSTHPATPDRIEAIRRRIEALPER